MTLTDFNNYIKEVENIEYKIKVLKGILKGVKEEYYAVKVSFDVESPYSTNYSMSKENVIKLCQLEFVDLIKKYEESVERLQKAGLFIDVDKDLILLNDEEKQCTK